VAAAIINAPYENRPGVLAKHFSEIESLLTQAGQFSFNMGKIIREDAQGTTM
jgi:hypothetical protein